MVERIQGRSGAPGNPPPRISFATRLRNYFFTGILVSAPISITVWLTWKVLSFIDDRVTPMIPPRWNPETYLPFSLPGLGLLIALSVLMLIGFFATGYVGRQFMLISGRLIARIPIARSIYTWTRQVFETVLSRKSGAFREVVLIEYPRKGCWSIGFITGRTEGEVQDLTAATVVNVFIPATPNPTTGFLLFIPEQDIQHLDITPEQGIKLVISGGIVLPSETGEAGRERAKAVAEAAAAEAERRDKGKKRRRRRRPRKSLVVRLRDYLFAGVLVTAPISITIWLTWEIVNYIDNQVTPLIPARWNPETYLPFGVPGLGVVLIILFLTLIGFLAAGLLGRAVVRFGERLLDQMPVVRGIYGATKQIMETVLREESNAFREVVLFEYPRPGSWALGFLTGKGGSTFARFDAPDIVSVFLPTTPNPTSGFLLYLPRRDVRGLSMTVEEGIKMVVSGGIVTPPKPAETDELTPGRPRPEPAAAEG